MRVIVFFSIFFISIFSHAEELWRGAMYGDSEERVSTLFPSHGNPIKSENLQRKGISSLLVAPIALANKTFNANFYFNNNGLYRVVLVADSVFNESESKSVEDFLAKAIREKYGNATKFPDPAKSVIEDQPFWMRWDLKSLSIMLVPQHGDSKIMISYDPSDETKKRLDESFAKQSLQDVSIKQEANKL